jgi:hypothetical protein
MQNKSPHTHYAAHVYGIIQLRTTINILCTVLWIIGLVIEQAVFLPTVFTSRNDNGHDRVQLNVRQR